MFILVYSTQVKYPKYLTRLDWIEQYKALIITFFLTGIVVLGMFSIQLKQRGDLITENFYEIEPEPELTEEEKKKLEDIKPTTDKAFNEDKEYKEMMRNFKSVSANDFERTTKALEEAKANEVKEDISINKSYANSKAYAVNSEETESYKNLQDKLNKRKDNKKTAVELANKRSTFSYSLIGRHDVYSDTPRYLCEKGGKIVVNIKVNGKGDVFEAYINGSSNSSNQCLIDHAIEYAKIIRFNQSPKKEQIGTITFLFKSKD